MATALQGTGKDVRIDGSGVSLAPPEPTGRARKLGSWFARDPAWPLTLMLMGWPLWWALGLAEFMPILVSIPVVRQMYRWRVSRDREIRVPPGFGLWLLFLVVMLASAMTLGLTAPGTMPSPASHRLISWGLRAVDYGSVTVLLLYVGNLTERELPRKRLAWLLSLVAIYAVGGSLAAVVVPSLHFTSPLSVAVPSSLQQSGTGEIYTMLHPGVTQIETFTGHGRVAAPFLYDNAWGNNLAILLPWLIVAWRSYGTPWQRKAFVPIAVLAVLGAVLSFDRGLWLALVLSVCYLAVRLAAQGRFTLLAAVFGIVALATVLILATPLNGLIKQRLSNGSSNAARTNLALLSTKDALSAPLIGYGDTRREYGSVQSIAIGRTAKCSACGQRSAGSNGQFWLLLITSGFPGTIFYLGFFFYGAWRYRRDTTAYGMAGELVLLLSFVFMFVYDAVGATLAFTMLAYAMLWRNEREMRLQNMALTPARVTGGVRG